MLISLQIAGFKFLQKWKLETHPPTNNNNKTRNLRIRKFCSLSHQKTREKLCLSVYLSVAQFQRNSCKTENEGHLLVTATESLHLHHTKTQPRNEILVARIAVWGEKGLAKSETNKTTDWRSRLHMYNNQPVGCMYITAKL